MRNFRNNPKAIRRASFFVLFVFIAWLAIYFGSLFAPAEEITQPQQPSYLIDSNYEEVMLDSIVDGDTLKCIVDNKRQKVRLIGIDTPESVSSDAFKNCEEGKLATEHTKELLKNKTTIWLSKDKSEIDVYNRLLRYVWLEKPSSQITNNEIKSKMLNAKLLIDGYAQAKDYEPDTSLSILFHQLGDEASSKNLGITYKWKEN